MKLCNYNLENWVNNELETAIQINGLHVLLLKIDYTQIPSAKRRKNLLATDDSDNIVWIAEFPEGESSSSYNYLTWNNKTLRALAGSTLCEINPLDGTIIKHSFSK